MIWHARLRWAVVTVLLAACSTAPTVTEAPVEPVVDDVVVDGDIDIRPGDQRMMYGVVVEAICSETDCLPAVVINDFGVGPEVTGRVLPPIVQAALSETLVEVNFVHPDVFRGNSALLFGPIQKRRDDLVSIMAGYLCGNVCGRGRDHFFLLRGDRWIPVAAEEAGFEDAIIEWTA
ncbi:MAG TPA: hypothetical protein VFT54_08995 [Acidimicrobiia bacterium]|nr:hypothetical protein [Acidimicrobiia bacterium]